MALNFKLATLLFIIVTGFLIFLLNAYKLNLNNKNIESTKEINPTQFIVSLKEKTKLSNNEIKNLFDEFSESKSNIKYTETVVIVKKGDHIIFICKVVQVLNNNKLKPLIYYNSKFY